MNNINLKNENTQKRNTFEDFILSIIEETNKTSKQKCSLEPKDIKLEIKTDKSNTVIADIKSEEATEIDRIYNLSMAIHKHCEENCNKMKWDNMDKIIIWNKELTKRLENLKTLKGE